jgi:hypothetical protein
VVETVELFPTEINFPLPSSKEVATEAAKQISYALSHPQPVGPFNQLGSEQLLALKKWWRSLRALYRSIYSGQLPPS